MTRVLTAAYADSVGDSIQRVMAFLNTLGQVRPSDRDWRVYQSAMKKHKEVYG